MEQEIEQLSAIYNLIVEFFVNYSFQLMGAIFILIIGIWLGNKISTIVHRTCERKALDPTLSAFFASTAKLIIIACTLMIALGKIGISIGPFVAALGAVSLGAGLALQSPLSNYGAGLNLILTRPFVIGDTIQVKDVTGIVKEIRLAYTQLTDEDDVEITIPNKHIIGEVIHNSHKHKLIELEVGISYQADPEEAISAIRNTLSALEIFSEGTDAEVGIDRFDDSNVVIAVRLWAETEQHFKLRYRANEAIYSALKLADIEIAFPQREVKFLNSANAA